MVCKHHNTPACAKRVKVQNTGSWRQYHYDYTMSMKKKKERASLSGNRPTGNCERSIEHRRKSSDLIHLTVAVSVRPTMVTYPTLTFTLKFYSGRAVARNRCVDMLFATMLTLSVVSVPHYHSCCKQISSRNIIWLFYTITKAAVTGKTKQRSRLNEQTSL